MDGGATTKPDIFITAKLTGCDLAFRGSGANVRVVHMNFAESQGFRESTHDTYKGMGYTIFGAGTDYRGETVVIGLLKGGCWSIYAQDGDQMRVTKIIGPK